MFGIFRKSPKIYKPIIMLEQLQERIVFDASVDVTAQENPDANAEANPEQAAPGQATEGQTDGAQDRSAEPVDPIDAVFNQDLSVVLLSNALDEFEALSNAAVDDAQVVVYDAEEDGLADINAILQNMVETTGSEIGHLAVVSHGAPGLLSFGDGEIWTTTSVNEEAGVWNELGSLLSEDARIDLYGCSIGVGEEGALFVETLAATTGAVVWASDDATGNVGNADWDLEVRTDAGGELSLLDTASLDRTPVLFPWQWTPWGVGPDGDNTITGIGECPSLNAQAGNDVVISCGDVTGSIFLRSGDDECSNMPGATVSNDINGDDGNDTVTNSGTVEGDIDGGDGHDEVINSGTVEGDIRGYNGADTLINHGTVHGIYGFWSEPQWVYTDGSNTIVNTGTVRDCIWCGGRADTVNNSGTVRGSIHCVLGNHTVNNSGTVEGVINGSDGHDTVVNVGVVTSVYGGPGDDHIANGILFSPNGTVQAEISGGAGNDYIVNLGTANTIQGNEENDTIWNFSSGQVFGDILAGDGDDTVYYEGGNVGGEINGGADTDTLHLAAGCTNIEGTPASGSCQWEGMTIQWSEFEYLVVDNTAPTLDNSGDMTLSSIAEDDVNNDGNTVAQIIGSNLIDPITDPDSNSVEGIAVTAVENTNGDWEYSLDSGGSWNAVGGVSETAALLLASDANIRFVPAADFYGDNAAEITFCAWDQVYGTNGSLADVTVRGGDTSFSNAFETANISVTAVNDDPVIHGVPTGMLTTPEDQSLVISGITVSDVDLQAAPVGQDTLMVSLSVSGSLQLAASGVTYLDGDGTDGTLSFTGTLDQVNDALANITYTPRENFNGIIALKLSVDDMGNYGDPDPGGDGVDQETVGIIITPVNDPPEAADGSVTMMENTTYTFTIDDFNFTDPDTGDTLQEVMITGLESVGSLRLGGANVTLNQVITVGDMAAGNLTFTPLPGQYGSGYDNFTFQVSDGGLWSDGDPQSPYTMTMDVKDVNSAPASADNTVKATEDTPYVFDLGDFAFKDADLGDTLHYVKITSLETAGDLKLNGIDVILDQVISKHAIEAGTLTFEPADDAFGSSYDSFDFKVSDGTDYSTLDYTMTVDVKSVNDAPELASGVYSFAGIDEDSTSAPATVTTILGGRASDADPGSDIGIAVYKVSSYGAGDGTWQYWTATGWQDFGAVSSTQALLLSSTDQIRFVGDGEDGESALFYCYAWDQSAGSVGDKVDVTTRGGDSAFSVEPNKVKLSVTSINDAPVLDPAGGSDFVTITEDDTNNSGYTVAWLVGDSISDVDNKSVEGIAIIDANAGNGTWQFRLNGSSVWQKVNAAALSDTNALLLTAEDSLRFQPDGENGTSATIEYVAWDQTQYKNDQGTYQDASAQGGANAFSTDTDIASIQVDSVNDAPVLQFGIISLTPILEDDTGNPGNTVAEIILSAGGDRITDVDTGAVEGIAVIDVDNTNGTWQFSTDGGASWTDFGAVSETSATLLADDANTRVRFVPDADYNGKVKPGITFKAWDQTDFSVDVSSNGGTTAYSAATGTAYISVKSVNDAPTSSGIPDPAAETQGFGTATYGVGAYFSDVDSSNLTFQLGTLTYHDGLALSGVAIDSATGLITFTNDPTTSGSVEVQVRASDGSAYTGWQTFTFTVIPVNNPLPQPVPEPDSIPAPDLPDDPELETLFSHQSSRTSFALDGLPRYSDTHVSQPDGIGQLPHHYSECSATGKDSGSSRLAEDQRSDALHDPTGLVDDAKKPKNTEVVLGLREFLARLSERQMGEGLEDIRLAFNAGEIELAEWFDAPTAASDWHNDNHDAAMGNLNGSSGPLPHGKTILLDLDEMRVADMLMSELDGSLFTRHSGHNPEPTQGITRAFDLNEVSFMDLAS